MKKARLFLIFLAILSMLSPVLAQRHNKNISAWGVHYGRTEKGHFYEGSFTNYLTDRLSVRVSGLRDFGNWRDTAQYAAFSGRVFLAPQLFRIGEVAYFHLLLGFAASYERTQQPATGDKNNEARRERFTYGPQTGIELDLFFSNRISMVASGIKGKAFNRSHIDQWPGFASIGFRYHFR